MMAEEELASCSRGYFSLESPALVHSRAPQRLLENSKPHKEVEYFYNAKSGE